MIHHVINTMNITIYTLLINIFTFLGLSEWLANARVTNQAFKNRFIFPAQNENRNIYLEMGFPWADIYTFECKMSV